MRRTFWASFRVPELEQRMAEPWQVLEQVKWTDLEKLPTVMASGTKSWNTASAVFEVVDGKLCKSSLKTVEMERAMGMSDGYTEMSGINQSLIGRGTT